MYLNSDRSKKMTARKTVAIETIKTEVLNSRSPENLSIKKARSQKLSFHDIYKHLMTLIYQDNCKVVRIQ